MYKILNDLKGPEDIKGFDADTRTLLAEEIRDRFGAHLSLVIDGGACHLEPTSVIDLRDLPPVILREGRGDLAPFQV